MARRRPQAQVRVARGGEDPNQLIGPVLRSDVVALLCFVLAGYMIFSTTWPVLASLLVIAGLFSGLSPRMEGPFGFIWGNSRIGGNFISPTTGQRPLARGQLRIPTPRRLPAPDQALPPDPPQEAPPDIEPDEG